MEGTITAGFFHRLPANGQLINQYPMTNSLPANVLATSIQQFQNLSQSPYLLVYKSLKAQLTSYEKQQSPQGCFKQSAQSGVPLTLYLQCFLLIGIGKVDDCFFLMIHVGTPSPQNFYDSKSWWNSTNEQIPYLPAKLTRSSILWRYYFEYPFQLGQTPAHMTPSLIPLQPHDFNSFISSQLNDDSQSNLYVIGKQGGTLTTTLGPLKIIYLPWLSQSLPLREVMRLRLREIRQNMNTYNFIEIYYKTIYQSLKGLRVIGSYNHYHQQDVVNYGDGRYYYKHVEQHDVIRTYTFANPNAMMIIPFYTDFTF